MSREIRLAMALLMGVWGTAMVGCGGSGEGGGGTTDSKVIRMEGSDTMVNLAQAWAEAYRSVRPDISVEVSGGGSGVGIAAMIEGVTDMANASRTMKDRELMLAQQNTGETPKEHIVGLDALAVYIHKDNPLESISIEELREIYADGGTITQWSQLGVKNVSCQTDKITLVSRQNNSGTYFYFREAVLGDQDYKLGTIDQSGSKDVVALVTSTPCAIGYSGMGYVTDDVKWLKISKAKGEEGVAPSVESASDGTYPIARPLMIYTSGEPTGEVKEYLDWILSEQGQKIVFEMGYVPVKAEVGSADEAASEDDGSSETDAADASDEE